MVMMMAAVARVMRHKVLAFDPSIPVHISGRADQNPTQKILAQPDHRSEKMAQARPIK
jgi:hypothetical protein